MEQEEMTEPEAGLMRACIGWTPADGALEDDPRVRTYLAAHPTHRELVWRLQLLLIHGRLTGGRPKGGE